MWLEGIVLPRFHREMRFYLHQRFHLWLFSAGTFGAEKQRNLGSRTFSLTYFRNHLFENLREVEFARVYDNGVIGNSEG